MGLRPHLCGKGSSGDCSATWWIRLQATAAPTLSSWAQNHCTPHQSCSCISTQYVHIA